MSKVYIISDLHLGHDNLAIHRGFFNANHQDKTIQERWNKNITKHDTVFILGDIAMNKKFYPRLDSLMGKKIVILGNHDLPKYTKELLNHVFSVGGSIQKSGCILTHIPIHESQLERYRLNIHGHTHEVDIDDPRYINVTCEKLNYTPVLLDSIIHPVKENG